MLLSEAQIRVRGKGNKTRFLPLAPEAAQLLDHYLRLERPADFDGRSVCFSQGPRSRRPDDSRGIALAVSPSSPDYRRQDGQPPSFSAHLRLGYGARRRQPAGPDAVDGPCADPNHARLYASHSSRGLSAVCESRRAAHQARTSDRRHETLLATLRWTIHWLSSSSEPSSPSLPPSAPDSARQYRGAARDFLIYLGEHHPAVASLNQLRRDPHVLGWFAHLRSSLAPAVYICSPLLLRCMLEELAWTAQLPDLAHLIRREDFRALLNVCPAP